MLLALLSHPVQAQWLLGFSPANTLAPGDVAFISGTGGQWTVVGEPGRTSVTPFIPHAGVRLGVFNGLDVGYRLVQVAIPYSSRGPTLGTAVDAKVRLTSADATWQAGVVLGGGFAYLLLEDAHRVAWSPGVDVILSRPLSSRHTLFTDLRYSYTGIPSAPGGARENHYTAYGAGAGLRIALAERRFVIPELGVFRLAGPLGGQATNGFGVQGGIVIGFTM